MKRFIAAVVLSFVVAAAAAFVVTAGEPTAPSQDSVIKVGKYRDLTLMRRLKIGTAPYVNPALLVQTAVAYKYDAGLIVDQAGASVMASQLAAGQMGLAKVEDDGSYNVMGIDTPEWEALIADVKSLTQMKNSVVLISHSDTLFGVSPMGAIISWYAVTPLVKE